MDKGAWQATFYTVAESDTTEATWPNIRQRSQQYTMEKGQSLGAGKTGQLLIKN